MYRNADDIFHLSTETRQELERVDHELHEKQALPKAGPLAGELSAALGGMRGRLLKAAKSYKAQTDWSTFAPSEPVVAVKHFYDVSEDSWVEETVMVEIDSKPFGHGALRECFRMREVPMRVDGHFSRQISEDTPKMSRQHSPGDEDEVGTPKSANIQDTVAAMMQISNKTKRRCWVAKRSTTGHGDLEKHKQDCLADAALQQVAKHHAEAFNSARRSIGHVPAHIGMHEVDFLMSHVIELPDGSTYGVEAFVFGHYEKYNNNSGGVMRPLDWVTPQAFSYFTFVHSGYRQMVVDIQGVDDIFTDPVLHYLPEHNRTLAALGDQSVNLGVRGFALFLWSHRRNPIDKLLGLATFPHAVSEQRAVGGVAGLTVAHLATVERPPPAAGLQRAASAQPSASPTHHSVPLADVPGVNLQVSSWSGVRARGVGAAEGHALPLDLVLAACHMELALMYNEGRIGEGNDKQSENEAAVFHLVLAAREGLMEAMLGLARLCSGLSHDDLLPEVECNPEQHGALCLHLLERVAEAPSSPSSLAARGSLAGLLASGSLGDVDAPAAARHYEAFAEAASGAGEDGTGEGDTGGAPPVRGLEVTSRHGATFGWEDHGLEAHSAYAKAAEIRVGEPGKDAKAHAKRLWEAASECAMEDPRLAKQAMRYMERGEALDPEAEDEEEAEVAAGAAEEAAEAQGPAGGGDDLLLRGVPPAVRLDFERLAAELSVPPAEALAGLLRAARGGGAGAGGLPRAAPGPPAAAAREATRLGFEVVWEAERPSVGRVAAGSQAERSGVRSGDVLVSIGGTETRGVPRERLAPLLRGAEPLELRLLRRAAPRR